MTTLIIGGNAVAAAGRDLHIENLNIYPAAVPGRHSADTEQQLNRLTAEFAADHYAARAFCALNSAEMRSIANYRELLENLVLSASNP